VRARGSRSAGRGSRSCSRCSSFPIQYQFCCVITGQLHARRRTVAAAWTMTALLVAELGRRLYAREARALFLGLLPHFCTGRLGVRLFSLS
jgi:hypothetical protein